ncbi:hypothetical protein V9L05_02185 [Bernardetia sp. Wsw4-3y2]|uniref:hypothetical protein n=1 Tax=Bernardetia sp. Wsw4-3y2 TaxID=3127471 RepID=UPI0030D2C53D
MNTIKEETQIKSISETKLELIEWILTVNNLDVIQIILEKKREAEKAAYNKLFWEVAGSWQSEETGTELANQLYEDRNDYSREIDEL